ncbi:MAG: DNA mismatch repair protein MutS, partial [Lachnospiraceae bacterium]|nr:DNA mismatch repair protein MutS [Lachnospiraceae bacterium]
MTEVSTGKLSPMIQQYLKIHESVPDAFLMFRVGDFYEMFFDDAVKASKILDLVLTGKDCGLDERAPMCGVPYHAVDSYVSRLVDKGYKVAICDQMSDPKTSKGLVEREITRIVTS